MAISTQGIKLQHKSNTEENAAYTDLVAIKTFPDLGSAPQTIEVTTLSDTMQQFIKGVNTTTAMEFTANYVPTDYDELIKLADKEEDFALVFETGVKFSWKGKLSVWILGAGVNGVVEMKISILPTTSIAKVTA